MQLTSGSCVRRIYSPVIGALLVAGLVSAQVSQEEPFQPTAETYAELTHHFLERLPPHSGPPPLLDLSHPDNAVPAAGKKWEDKFSYSMGGGPVLDPGARTREEATSILTSTIDYAGRSPRLLAKSCSVIVIGKPLKASAHLASNRRFIYSTFEVELLQVLKGTSKKNGIVEGAHIIAAQLGGAVRFTSGHQVDAMETNEGFLNLGKEYVLFLWQPVKSSETYMTADAYLLEDGRIYAITIHSGESHYDGTQSEDFLRKVKNAIAKNMDTD